jgi:hypothetical protein
LNCTCNFFGSTSTVDVELSADDGDGSGVKQITYSASGANVIPETTELSDFVNVNLTESGLTTLTFYAEDNAGNVETAQNLVISIDTIDPSLDLPADLVVNATGPSGAVVTYSVDADDLESGLDNYSCAPASGDLFAIGVTSVNCTATDLAGNQTQGSFSVSVLGAADQLQALIQFLQDSDAPNGFKNSRVSQLYVAANSLQGENLNATCSQLQAFITSVSAQSGKQISTDLANELIERAENIKTVLGC